MTFQLPTSASLRQETLGETIKLGPEKSTICHPKSLAGMTCLEKLTHAVMTKVDQLTYPYRQKKQTYVSSSLARQRSFLFSGPARCTLSLPQASVHAQSKHLATWDGNRRLQETVLQKCFPKSINEVCTLHAELKRPDGL